MAFDINRFTNFAKYDLTINKNFYRNISIATLVGTIGIATFMFMMRYLNYESQSSFFIIEATNPNHYNYMTGSCCFVISFILIMMSIFAGCWAHNLREKQGRIIELTLPATNTEKFLWHIAIMLGGGFLVCLLSLLIADGVNAILTASVCGTEDGIASLTVNIGKLISIQPMFSQETGTISVNGEAVDAAATTPELNYFLWAMGALVISSCIAEPLCYVFGNALKYKYNIILTYIAMQIIGFIFAIFFLISMGTILNSGDIMESIVMNQDKEMFITVGNIFIAIAVIQLLVSVGLVLWSYRLYAKAQITTSFNK